jgi:iron complex outermembrane receptor protein
VGDSLHINAKGYTYYYGNRSYDTASIGTKAWNRGDNVGRYKLSAYRAFGETINASWDNPYGVLKVGAWHEYHRSKRIQYGLDYTKGTFDYNPTADPRTAYYYDMVNYLFTTQLFAEYDWRVSKSLTVNAGVKNIQFKRKINADINQSTKTPLYYTKSLSKTLASGSANYSISNEWTVYAQVAQGFLAPNLNQFYVPNPDLNRADPQETMNYQVGTVYKTDRFNADFDVYQIDYKNFPRTTNDLTTGQTVVVMAKGAWFSGAEAEATYSLGGGLSVYANGSINKAEYKKSKLDVDMVTQSTGALGFIYDRGGFFGSVITKYVGQSKIYYSTVGFNPDDASTVTNTGVSKGYYLSDLAFGYGLKFNKSFFKSAKIKLEINNIFDRKVQVMDSFNGSGVILYNVLPNRNYFLSISGEF